MPEAKHRPVPVEFSTDWPNVVTERHDAQTARLLVVELLSVLEGRSLRSLARDAGLDEKTFRKIIAGVSWPDLRTVARLEEATGQRLYPRWSTASSCEVNPVGPNDLSGCFAAVAAIALIAAGPVGWMALGALVVVMLARETQRVAPAARAEPRTVPLPGGRWNRPNAMCSVYEIRKVGKGLESRDNEWSQRE